MTTWLEWTTLDTIGYLNVGPNFSLVIKRLCNNNKYDAKKASRLVGPTLFFEIII